MKTKTSPTSTSEPPLPKSIKIGWVTYAIEEWSVPGSVGADRYGECSHTENIIRVAFCYGTQQAASTLLHEIMHAIYALWNIKDQDEEERTVKTMAHGLSTVWLDNPAVLDWIGWHIQHGT